MVAGHLREQNGYYQMILSWKDNLAERFPWLHRLKDYCGK